MKTGRIKILSSKKNGPLLEKRVDLKDLSTFDLRDLAFISSIFKGISKKKVIDIQENWFSWVKNLEKFINLLSAKRPTTWASKTPSSVSLIITSFFSLLSGSFIMSQLKSTQVFTFLKKHNFLPISKICPKRPNSFFLSGKKKLI